MDAARLDIDVPEGWACRMDLTRTPCGTYVGIAELSFHGAQRCSLVITQQLSWDGALERAKLRANHFVRQSAGHTTH